MALLLAVAGCGISMLGPAARAQLSPGRLSAPHAALEGSSHCLDCHKAGKGVSAVLCLDCHVILRERIRDGLGLHANPDYERCERCHIDHHGEEYELIWYGKDGRESFDHQLTGYRLEGAHARLDCLQCHRESHIRTKEPLLAQGKDLAKTRLGLEGNSCLSCHEDEHREQFTGATCSNCHGLDQWKPAEGFEHEKARFRLTGLHVATPCRDCHAGKPLPSGKETLLFTGLDFDDCTDCHRDPHGVRPSATCESCHSTAGWQRLAGSTFNHDRTAFRLTGLHRLAACQTCHAKTAASTGLVSMPFEVRQHEQCADCHRDPHENRLGAQCQECHSTAGWARTDRAAFEHGKTRYPLEGAHAALECVKCHQPGQGFRVARFSACTDCHEDNHLGQMSSGSSGGACERCHSVQGFTPSLYSIEDHSTTSFALDMAHLAVPCTACHQKIPITDLPAGSYARVSSRTLRAGHTLLQFRFAATRCHDCHDDPHRGEARQVTERLGCEGCHSLESWRRPVHDHSKTEYPLEGAHQRAPCSGCHPVEKDGAGALSVQLSNLSTQCVACHTDIHRNQFAEPGGATACRGCHTVTSWRETSFEHDRDSRFALAGAHQDVACTKCHFLEGERSDTVIRFKPLETACESCHIGSAAQR